MVTVRLGKTEIVTDKNGFGALPIQRVSMSEAASLLTRAYEGGMTFFDTARMYTDSEEKMGNALSDVRKNIFIATKTLAKNADALMRDLETSLKLLKTDYIDVYQLHNFAYCPRPDGEDGLYNKLVQLKKEGVIRHIGITSHLIAVAEEIVQSELYETLQFPFSYLASDREIALVNSCKEKDIGYIAMKALSGGLIKSSLAAYAYINKYDNVLPIWGVQHPWELEEFLSYVKNPPSMTDEALAIIEKDRAELAGSFCRGCGYCMPCPAGIDISLAARMTLMLGRAPVENYVTPSGIENMNRINDCIDCGRCSERCPYQLDTPALLRENYEHFKQFIK